MKKYLLSLCTLFICCGFFSNTAFAKMLKVTSLSPRPLVMMFFTDTLSQDIGPNYLKTPMNYGQSITVNLNDETVHWDIMVFYAKNKKSYFGLESFYLGNAVELRIEQESFLIVDTMGRVQRVNGIKP